MATNDSLCVCDDLGEETETLTNPTSSSTRVIAHQVGMTENKKSPATPSRKTTPSVGANTIKSPNKSGGGVGVEGGEEQQQNKRQQQPVMEKRKRGRPKGWRKDGSHKFVGVSNKTRAMERSAYYARQEQLGKGRGKHQRYYDSEEEEHDYGWGRGDLYEDYVDNGGLGGFDAYTTRGSDDEQPSSSKSKKKKRGRPRKEDAEKYRRGMEEAQTALERNLRHQERTDRAVDRADSRQYAMLQERYNTLKEKYDDLKKKKVEDTVTLLNKQVEAAKAKDEARDRLVADLRQKTKFYKEEYEKSKAWMDEKAEMSVQLYKLQEDLVQKRQDVLQVQKKKQKLREDLKIALQGHSAQVFGLAQFEALSGLRWSRVETGVHEFQHVKTGFKFTLEACQDEETGAPGGEDPLNAALLGTKRVSAFVTYKPVSMGIIPQNEIKDDLLRDHMDFATPALPLFFTRFLDTITDISKEIGIDFEDAYITPASPSGQPQHQQQHQHQRVTRGNPHRS